MAEDGSVETALTGEILNSIPYESMIAQPLRAMVESNAASAQSALDFVLSVGFEKTEGEESKGVRRATYAEFSYEEKDDEGTHEKTIRIPMLCIVNIPNVMVDTGIISFSIEISQSATLKQDISASGELSGSIGWGPFSVGLSAKASYNRENTRKTDTRARQEITLNVKQADPPEAISVMLEIFREAALGTRQ